MGAYSDEYLSVIKLDWRRRIDDHISVGRVGGGPICRRALDYVRVDGAIGDVTRICFHGKCWHILVSDLESVAQEEKWEGDGGLTIENRNIQRPSHIRLASNFQTNIHRGFLDGIRRIYGYQSGGLVYLDAKRASNELELAVLAAVVDRNGIGSLEESICGSDLDSLM